MRHLFFPNARTLAHEKRHFLPPFITYLFIPYPLIAVSRNLSGAQQRCDYGARTSGIRITSANNEQVSVGRKWPKGDKNETFVTIIVQV